MENVQRKNKTYIFFAMTAIAIMLFGAPFFSWYYLKGGFNYRKQALNELMYYGRLDSLGPSLLYGLNSDSSYKEKVTVWVLMNDKSAADKKLFFEHMDKFEKQFSHEPAVRFVILSADTNLQRKEQLPDPLSERDMFEVWPMSDSILQQWGTTVFGTPVYVDNQIEEDIPGRLDRPSASSALNYFVLVDRNLNIRNFYNFQKLPRMGRLVEHLAILIPPPKVEKPTLIRTEEK